MAANNPLHQAKRQKKDEFYTQLPDIEKELRHYKDHFRDKVVYCNCDDPYESNFFKFFASNFNALGLKRLITTSWDRSVVCGEQLSLGDIAGLGRHENKKPYKIDIRHVCDFDGDGAIGMSDVDHLLSADSNAAQRLAGDGDFRSCECMDLLKQADIVVTNPPFSLFREYLGQIMEHGKRFLILADQNAITYKETFSYIKDNRLWLGDDNGGNKWFRVPMEYDIKTESRKKIENGVKYFSMGRIVWFTNLDYPKRHEDLILYKRYSPDEYPKYDNYDAINVDKTSDIPVDYPGEMGVPITFLNKHNPDQFEIVKFRKGDDEKDLSINGKPTYFRIIIRRV